jgi:hypothetical protein
VDRQIAALRKAASEARTAASSVPRIAQLFVALSGASR